MQYGVKTLDPHTHQKKKGEEEEERRPERTNQQHQKNFLIKKYIENRKKASIAKLKMINTVPDVIMQKEEKRLDIN